MDAKESAKVWANQFTTALVNRDNEAIIAVVNQLTPEDMKNIGLHFYYLGMIVVNALGIASGAISKMTGEEWTIDKLWASNRLFQEGTGY